MSRLQPSWKDPPANDCRATGKHWLRMVDAKQKNHEANSAQESCVKKNIRMDGRVSVNVDKIQQRIC